MKKIIFSKSALVFASILSLFNLFGCASSGQSPIFEKVDGGTSTAQATPSVNSPDGSSNFDESNNSKIITISSDKITLPENFSTKSAVEEPFIGTLNIDQAVWVRGISAKLIDKSGNELPQKYLRELILSNASKKNPLCNNANDGAPFFIATPSAHEINFPNGLGYILTPSNPINFRAIIINSSDIEIKDAAIEIKFITEPLSNMEDRKNLTAILLEPNPCTHEANRISPNSYEKKNYEFQISETGVVNFAYAALQNFSISIELFKNSAPKVLWQGFATENNEHEIISIQNNPYDDSKGIAINSGDNLSVNFSYENTTNSWIDNATGSLLIFLTKIGE